MTNRNPMDQSSLSSKTILTRDGARFALERAEAKAVEMGWRMCIAIVDDGGHLQTFARMDNTHIGSIRVSMEKARTALYFRRPSKVFADLVSAAGSQFLGLPDVLPFEGGVPIEWNGQVIGAVGVSGGSPEADGQVALAGALSFNGANGS